MKLLRKAVLAGSAISVMALVGTGIASASIPDSGGVITACYQNPPPAHGANLEVIDTGAGGSCSGGHTQLTWSQSATAGPAGLATEIIYVGGSTNAFAECPSDHPYLLGGGAFSDGTGDLDYSGPIVNGYGPTVGNPLGGGLSSPYAQLASNTQGWFAQTTESGEAMYAYAICAK